MGHYTIEHGTVDSIRCRVSSARHSAKIHRDVKITPLTTKIRRDIAFADVKSRDQPGSFVLVIATAAR